jgi:prepilin-type processing-associated H-X9-DG protein
VVRWIVYGSCCLLALWGLACAGFAVPFELILWTTCGWVMYLVRVAPGVTVSVGGVGMGVACLVLLAAGSHVFLRWLAGEVAPTGRPWRPRWTAMLLALVLLMFVAGIAATGVVHQVGWLVTSPELFALGGGEAVLRAQSTNNLKQIGLGLLNYHDRHGVLPPGGTLDGQGRPLHGWQTLVLPFLEMESSELAERVQLDLAWDDPRNAAVFQTEVPFYLIPGVRTKQSAEGFALSHYAGNVRVLGGTIPLGLPAFRDGTSATILAGEVGDGFLPWGYPANWRDPAQGINQARDGFGAPWKAGANFLFGDGSVHFLRQGINPRVLEALSTPAGGETIHLDSY